ncbi:transcription factor RFX4 [Trichonephila clavipes]|nr:transcription factor RFX4 [Trichonephila clavipes]
MVGDSNPWTTTPLENPRVRPSFIVVGETPLYATRTRTGTILPEFPSVKDLHLPPTVDVDKMSTFPYDVPNPLSETSDTIVRATFDEVQNFLLHFWQGIPPHLLPVLESNALVNLVGVCDCILYRTISNVLLPSMLHTLPERSVLEPRIIPPKRAILHHRNGVVQWCSLGVTGTWRSPC